jgi:hypothetical protein
MPVLVFISHSWTSVNLSPGELILSTSKPLTALRKAYP